jgi:hypothetical protein
MKYPQPLSFPGSPSLLNKANPKALNVLFVNYHAGVEMEVHAVLAKVAASINQSVHFTHTRGVGDLADFIVTEAASLAYYPLHTDHCNSSIYDLIVVGDVVTYSRPYLQSACKTNIILYITNRFDFSINNDSEYHALLSTASRWPNVRVIVNNLHEHNYALTARNADIHVYAYAPSTGLLSDTARNMLSDSQVNWSTVDKNELIVVNKPGQNSLHSLLEKHEIPLPFIPSRYGGPLGLAGRFLVHIPYQVNTMALFENLNNGVLYILPSVRLYCAWLEDGTATMDSGERRWTEKELRKYVDWYRTDLSYLFFYFEDIEDLAPKSAFREMVEKEAEAKRGAVRNYMLYHVDRTIEAWRQAVGSFPRLSDAQVVRRDVPLVAELPQVADLPPATPGTKAIE